MIERFAAKNFGCLKETSLALTRVHALVGPNDSGKSTILAALHAARGIETGRFHAGPIDLRYSPGAEFRVSRGTGTEAYELRGAVLVWTRWGADGRMHEQSIPFGSSPTAVAQRDDVRGSLRTRFDPDALREKSRLIPESDSPAFIDEQGRGLAGVYLRILGRGDDAFAQIRTNLQRLFPTVSLVRFPGISQAEFVTQAHLRDGTVVPAEHLSEGLLYYLAFAALPYVAPTSLLLVEEPENGLHPARIEELVRVLRAFAEEQDAQVVMATHSPLVLNELEPNEISVVTRTLEDGTKVRPLTETKDFARRSKVYSPGELWIAYADGVTESDLTDDAPPATGTDP